MKALLNHSVLALALGFAITSVGASAHAGSAQAEIDCTSASGKTKIQSIFPGDTSEANLLFSIEGKTLAYENIDNKEFRDMNGNRFGQEFEGAAIVDIEANDFLPKAFSLKVLKAGAVVLQMKAMPETIKIKKSLYGQSGKFSAKVQGVDPRHGGPSMLIIVNCAYRYEI